MPLWSLALAGTIGLWLLAAVFGEVNQDEGWYLYAARLITEGKLPFVHFASTQGPMLPLVYASGFPLVRDYGLLGGRVLTLIFAAVGLFVACVAGGRLAPERTRPFAALVTLMLLGLNVYQAYFTSITKTYALTGLWLVCGLLALVDARGSFWKCMLAGAYLALAAGTRISAGAFAAVAGAVLLWHSCRGGTPGRTGWAGLGIGFGVVLLAILGPFYWKAPEAFQFGMFDYHAGREAGSVVSLIAYKVGFIARVLAAYLAPLSIAGLTLLLGRPSTGKTESGEAWAGVVTRILWLGVAAVTLVHLAAPFPYDDYQVILAPLFCVGTAVAVAHALAKRREYKARVAIGIGVLCIACCVSSPLLMGWFVGERDRIWWPLKTESSLANLRRTADRVRELAGRDKVILTQDLYLAVEAGLSVPSGLEMGPFSYFPGFSDEQAERCHVLNEAGMTRLLLNTEVNVAAFSDYGLAIQCPAVTPISPGERSAFGELLARRYQVSETVAHFGQARTPLRILTRRTEEPTSGAE